MISCEDKECSGLAREQVHRIRSVEAKFPIDAWPEAKSRKDSVKVPCIDGLRSNQSEAHLMVCEEMTDS